MHVAQAVLYYVSHQTSPNELLHPSSRAGSFPHTAQHSSPAHSPISGTRMLCTEIPLSLKRWNMLCSLLWTRHKVSGFQSGIVKLPCASKMSGDASSVNILWSSNTKTINSTLKRSVLTAARHGSKRPSADILYIMYRTKIPKIIGSFPRKLPVIFRCGATSILMTCTISCLRTPFPLHTKLNDSCPSRRGSP